MRKITNWDVFDWDQDGEDRLELWVDIKFLPEDIVKYGKYDFMNGVVDKVNETTPEKETIKCFRGHYDAHTRYILGENANKRKERIAQIRKANARKRFFGKDAYIIISRFEGKDKPYFKESRIMECNLLERKHRDRRGGKKICRDAMMGV